MPECDWTIIPSLSSASFRSTVTVIGLKHRAKTSDEGDESDRSEGFYMNLAERAERVTLDEMIRSCH